LQIALTRSFIPATSLRSPKMPTLAALTRRAQARASGDMSLVVLNLNPIGAPVYVIRDARAYDTAGRGACVAGPFYGAQEVES